MPKRSDFKSTDQYIASFPDEVQSVLQNLRFQIKKSLPGCEEIISYQIPCFKLNGKYVIYFAAFKSHISLYPIPPGSKTFQNKIAPFVKGKGTISFSLNKPLPKDLISEIVKHALEANLQRTGKI